LGPLHLDAALTHPGRARGIALDADDRVRRARYRDRVGRRRRDGKRTRDDEHAAIVDEHRRVDVIKRAVIVSPALTAIGNINDGWIPWRTAALLPRDHAIHRDVRLQQCVVQSVMDVAVKNTHVPCLPHLVA
jgi:hypothetical protein